MWSLTLTKAVVERLVSRHVLATLHFSSIERRNVKRGRREACLEWLPNGHELNLTLIFLIYSFQLKLGRHQNLSCTRIKRKVVAEVSASEKRSQYVASSIRSGEAFQTNFPLGLTKAPGSQSRMGRRKKKTDLMRRLPAELRNRIYDLCLPRRIDNFPCREPPLLKTCRWIRNEARPMFWGNLPAVFARCYLGSPDFKRTVEALTSIVKTCGKAPFKKIYFKVGGPIRPHLINLLLLLEMMRATGFDPSKNTYEPYPRKLVTTKAGRTVKRRFPSGRSIFWMASTTNGPLQHDLEMAFALPRRARAEGWTAERFEADSGHSQSVKERERGRRRRSASPRSSRSL